MPTVGESLTVPFTVGEGAAAPGVVAFTGQKPPLELQAEVVYPDSTTARWDRDSREAPNRPGGISFRTKRYTGFGDAQFSLPRRIDRDYPDLGLLRGINLVCEDGSVAFEGRIAAQPRSLQGTPSIGIQGQGWMAHANDQPFVEVFIDRDMNVWAEPSASRRVQILTANGLNGSVNRQPDAAGAPTVELAVPGPWVAPFSPFTEAWWPPHAGVSLGALYYDLTSMGGSTSFAIETYLSSDDQGSVLDASGSLPPAPKAGYVTAAGTRTAALLRHTFGTTPSGAAGATYTAVFQKLAVYGTHGLTRRGEDPGGFYVSDMVKNIASRWAPLLDTSGVEATTFIVPHASFLSETFAYDAWQTLNTYHRWEMDVYEGRRLNFYPIDLSDWDWEIRLSDPGTTVELQGDDVSSLCNGVIVRYRDLATGYERRLTPEGVAALKDESPDNPANEAGVKLYTKLALSVPTTEEGAIQIGRAYLGEFNQAQSPGTITVTGHVRDRAQHWQQGWKVRASDRLIISDLPNESVRVVGETEWNHDAKTLKIAVDSSFKRLDAVLARFGVAVEASGVSLP